MKKILFLIFFASVLKVGAQENRFEISLGLGPSYAANETPRAGIEANGKLGYKVNKVLTVFAGAEFISFPINNEDFVLPPWADSSNPGRVKSIEVYNGRGLMRSVFLGGRISFLAQNLFSPYITASIGLFDVERTRSHVNSAWIMYEDYDALFPALNIILGGGVNVNLDTDKTLFAEVTIQGTDVAAFASAIFGTRIRF